MKLLIGLTIIASGILVTQSSYANPPTNNGRRPAYEVLPCGKLKFHNADCNAMSTDRACGSNREQASNRSTYTGSSTR
jgi:hypothetical protein